MMLDVFTNILSECVVRSHPAINGCMLDKKNIVWKVVGDKWIGKRSVWTYDNRACWLEDTVKENVKEWWCGEDSDYNEIFYRQ